MIESSPEVFLDPSQEGEPQIPPAFRLFLQESLKSLRSTAAVFPSSKYLTRALLSPVDFSRARVVVELGPGTGAVTTEILKRMRPDGTLYAIDNNMNFIRHLKRSCNDPRMIAVHANAEHLLRELRSRGAYRADAVVSSLGLTSMEPAVRTSIVSQAWTCLRAGGVLTQYQYVVARAGFVDLPNARVRKFDERSFLCGFFGEVRTKYVLRNLPPACVYSCKRAIKRYNGSCE
jgi:phosphatidylethanolamine/phosphatidyl-N-methylethanolamine N-methyltransferase